MTIDTGAGPSEQPLDDEEDVVAEGAEEFDGSLIGQLRARHDEIRTTKYHLDLAIPGYDNLLWVRFRPYKISKQEKKARAIARRYERGEDGVLIDSALQNLIDGCEQIMLLRSEFDGKKGPDGANLKPIDDEEPIKFDQRLNEILKLGVTTNRAHDVVLSLFPTEQGIMQMSATVTRWLADVTKEAGEEFLGE